MSKTIGFLGLGHMGGPMAANLVKAGYDVHAFDPSSAAQEQARADGVALVDTGVAAATGRDIVITMLTNGKLVRTVYDELLSVANPGTLFVDCSTIDVADARAAAEAAAAAGHRALDAPVSGGVSGAAAGTLTFMVGGADTDFAEALPVLEVMGAKVVHTGASGNGQAAKICNNMLLGISMVGLSEALVLGEKLGLSHQAFFDVVSTASGQSWALTTYCPVPGPVPTSPANNDYKPGFATALMNKDLGLAVEALRANGVEGRIGQLAAEIYREFNEGSGDRDFSAIITDVRGRSGGANPAG
ncbi:3-hydroxyisobutyrate dehydrogenase [Nocardia jinanensis]|uniref:3-hydroxyisobutyrate dehydrogenase n=1 Tax=Nocardia jinanensis TaxID=382504 RepID=A0A917VYC6_9NOCA|nr:3-hydroxyisobutyrate dehydrogenase [Nocardia jinanensis]GGL36164.1 3-hydroxyisobutyrate dehydrogenase [Nocardia jinanensis]